MGALISIVILAIALVAATTIFVVKKWNSWKEEKAFYTDVSLHIARQKLEVKLRDGVFPRLLSEFVSDILETKNPSFLYDEETGKYIHNIYIQEDGTLFWHVKNDKSKIIRITPYRETFKKISHKQLFPAGEVFTFYKLFMTHFCVYEVKKPEDFYYQPQNVQDEAFVKNFEYAEFFDMQEIAFIVYYAYWWHPRYTNEKRRVQALMRTAELRKMLS